MTLIDKLKEEQVKSEEPPVYQMKNQNHENIKDLNELKELLKQTIDLLKETKDSRDLKDLEELMKQTIDLNDLMRGYIRTNMDKSTAEKLTFDTEIANIRTTGKQVTDQMLSILPKQENLLNNSVQMLQKVLTEARNEMRQNNNLTVQKMDQIESVLSSSLNQINDRMNQNMNELERRTSNLIGRARKGILINDWLDVAKYGLGTSVIGIVLYTVLKSLLGLVGVHMP